MGLYPAPTGPEPDPRVREALAPFVAVSALGSTVLVGLFAAAFLLPLTWAQRQGWTGGLGLAGPALLALAVPVLAWVYLAGRKGVWRQLRPLGQVASALLERYPGAAPRARGRLRRGWGAEVTLAPLPDGGAVRAVAARGPRSRPDLYLVRGDLEYRFGDVRDPLPELDAALRAVGLA